MSVLPMQGMIHPSDDEDDHVSGQNLGLDLLLNRKKIQGNGGNDGGLNGHVPAFSPRESSESGDSDGVVSAGGGGGGGGGKHARSVTSYSGSESGYGGGGGGHRQPAMTAEDLLNAKREILYQLSRLEKKGVRVPRQYTMSSNYEEMKAEYERLKRDIEVDASVRFQRRMLMACVSGLEFVNNRFDPFEVYLDGWSESVQDNIMDYDDIFEELHTKYRGKMKMAPELRLMFTLGGSAVWFHMSHSMFKSSSIPGIEQVFAQNPELKKQFMAATFNTMQGGSGSGGGSGGSGSGGGAVPTSRGGGGGGGLFSGMGGLMNGFFGGASARGGPPTADPPRTPRTAATTSVGRRNMRGPAGVDEILQEINHQRFEDDDMAFKSHATSEVDDPSRLLEVFSNGEEGVTDDDMPSSNLSSDGEGMHRPGSRRRRERRTLNLD
jgi:hypothetical protein